MEAICIQTPYAKDKWAVWEQNINEIHIDIKFGISEISHVVYLSHIQCRAEKWTKLQTQSTQ